jgi:hypothetical protein
MNTENYPDDEAERTLRSLEGLERATPRPFFRTRTEARLDKRIADGYVAGRALRPLLAGVSLGLLFLLNLSVIGLFNRQFEVADSTPNADLFAADWQPGEFFNWTIP